MTSNKFTYQMSIEATNVRSIVNPVLSQRFTSLREEVRQFFDRLSLASDAATLDDWV